MKKILLAIVGLAISSLGCAPEYYTWQETVCNNEDAGYEFHPSGEIDLAVDINHPEFTSRFKQAAEGLGMRVRSVSYVHPTGSLHTGRHVYLGTCSNSDMDADVLAATVNTHARAYAALGSGIAIRYSEPGFEVTDMAHELLHLLRNDGWHSPNPKSVLYPSGAKEISKDDVVMAKEYLSR